MMKLGTSSHQDRGSMATKYRLAGHEAVSRQKNSLHFGRQMCVIDKPSTTNNKLHTKYNNVARMIFLAIFFVYSEIITNLHPR